MVKVVYICICKLNAMLMSWGTSASNFVKVFIDTIFAQTVEIGSV